MLRRNFVPPDAGQLVLESQQEQAFFLFFKNVQTGPGAHPASCSVGTGVLSWAVRQVDLWPLSSVEVKNEWSSTPTPLIHFHVTDKDVPTFMWSKEKVWVGMTLLPTWRYHIPLKRRCLFSYLSDITYQKTHTLPTILAEGGTFHKQNEEKHWMWKDSEHGLVVKNTWGQPNLLFSSL